MRPHPAQEAKPKTDWGMAKLAALTGLRPRTIRYYVDHGVLERSELRGNATRYQRTYLLAVQRLRRGGVPTLAVRQVAEQIRAYCGRG